jgi:Tfp pilus assembly protein PilX
MRQRRFEHQRGQVLLVIVLLITVATTIGLSVATRSIVNLRLSAEEDHTQRAFSAAEAGLEQSLLSDMPISNGTFSNAATYDTQIISNRNTAFLFSIEYGKTCVKR